MTTIAEENRKYLRNAMIVECGFKETDDEPTSMTPVGEVDEYVGISNLERSYLTEVLMDLSGSGFLNNGEAKPMRTDTDSRRYGFMSSGVAKADGTFETPFGVTLEADEPWRHVTLELMGQYGDTKILQINPIWFSGQTTVYVDTWTPGERVSIVGVFLGSAWIWNNTNLIDVNLDLRSVNTEIGGELEVSSISIEAYETTDFTDYIGTIPLGAPIWYMAGYDGDLSEIRKFYLSEMASWSNNVLEVKGQDATSLIEGVEVPWQWYTINAGNSITWIVKDMLQRALDLVDYDVIGSEPQLTYGSREDVYFEGMAPRTIISLLTGLYRDNNYLRVTYVDAGIPTLTWGDDANNYTIYADEIADLNITVEQNVNEIDANIATYSEGELESYETFDAVTGRTYFFTFDDPVTYFEITPAYRSYEWIGYKTLKLVANTTGEHSLSIKKLVPIIVDGDNPYRTTEIGVGVPYEYDGTLPAMLVTSGSLTKLSLPTVISQSNKVFEFTYRGNPHIQPRDVLNVEVATWEDVFETVDGLFPAEDLYPATDLYPYAVYKKVRKMIKHWEIMTVDSVTLEHKEGGLTSTIRARKGVV